MSSPSVRRSLFGSTWSIVAPARSGRPQPGRTGALSTPSRCPFCEGHEADTEPEVLALRRCDSRPDGPGWTLRVVPNKYPALDARPFQGVGIAPHVEIAGHGFHEVVVDTPRHDLRMAAFSRDQWVASLLVYRGRLVALGRHASVESFALFRNEGRAAGASQEHSHAQLLALPLVAPGLQQELEAASQHRQRRGSCLTCDLLAAEYADGRRIVAANDHFVAMTSFAGRFQYETWLVPKRHSHDFRECETTELQSLAAILRDILLALEVAVGPVALNLVLQTSPIRMTGGAAHAFHWRFEVIPRLTVPSGFELGCGLFIVSVSPEDAAGRLRAALATNADGREGGPMPGPQASD